MDEFWKTLLIACIPSLLTGLVTYFVAHKNASAQIKVVKEQNKHDIDKLMEQHKVDIDSLKEKFGQNVKSQAVISIMAGKKLGFVKEVVDNDACSIVRIMPNLACRYGEGVTLAQLTDVEGELKDYVKNLLEKLGVLIEVEEKDFNFCSSVSGCGPAFFFEYFKYFYNQCVAYGLDEQDAKKMVLQTACGSAKLAMNSTESFEKLISNVCSKGGSTIEGVKVIESSDMEQIVEQTLCASTKRNKELEQV